MDFVGAACWMVVFPDGAPLVRVGLSLVAAGLLALFAWRVVFHLRRARLSRSDLSFNPLSTARVPV
jgi:hypothetical protein